MTRRIDRDLSRFKQIVRGKVRKQLKKYITHGEMMGRQGKRTVSIPVPNIDIPHFQHGRKGGGGVGQGEGDVGQPIGRGQDEGDGPGQAGSDPGSGHFREVEITFEELAEMLAEELELPNIVPKGQDSLVAHKDKYSTIRQQGPESLRHFKRTYKRALKRLIASDQYNPERPVIVPTRDDQLYRSWKSSFEPKANAAIVYMMDVSGSMTSVQKEIVRTEAFWIDTWLKSQYDGVQQVDEDDFYHTHESGGTRISSAYTVAARILGEEFPSAEWNIYCFQFSDGDNWGEDNKSCLELLTEKILPHCNLFCYGQVDSPYGSGDFIRELRQIQDDWENVVLSEIDTKEDIYDSIKTFLGKGA